MTVLRKRKIGNGASDMTKKILILSGSPRKQGNSDLLCDEERKSGEAVAESFCIWAVPY